MDRSVGVDFDGMTRAIRISYISQQTLGQRDNSVSLQIHKLPFSSMQRHADPMKSP